MNIYLERAKRFCGFVVGIVFFVSGVFKLLDPVGAALVMEGYYKFLHIEFMLFSAKFMAVAFAFAEAVLGAALVTGVWRKVIAVAVLCFQGFFTLLTLALVIFNPEMECGCFGEVIHLTHAETFVKNLILCALASASFFPFSAMVMPKKRKYVSFAVVSSLLVAFTVYSLLFIPLADFTSFKPAVRLAASESGIDSQDAGEAFDVVFVYEKDGVREEFTLESLPDSTWTYVSTETLEKKESAIEDEAVSLPVIGRDGLYYDSVAATGKVMVVSVHAPEKLSMEDWSGITGYSSAVRSAGFTPLVLVSSTPAGFDEVLKKLEDHVLRSEIQELVYFSDYKTLISMNRSNGGVTYFQDGFLLRKWAFRNYPDREDLDTVARADATEIVLSYSTNGNLTFQGFMLTAFAVMLLI